MNSFSFVNHCSCFVLFICLFFFIRVLLYLVRRYLCYTYNVTQFFFFKYYVVYSSFRKRASANSSKTLFHGFLVPENNDPLRVTTPRNQRASKAANSESNEGRYYGKFTVSLNDKIPNIDLIPCFRHYDMLAKTLRE